MVWPDRPCPDPEAHDQNGEGREARISPQRPQRITDVLEETVPDGQRATVSTQFQDYALDGELPPKLAEIVSSSKSLSLPVSPERAERMLAASPPAGEHSSCP